MPLAKNIGLKTLRLVDEASVEIISNGSIGAQGRVAYQRPRGGDKSML